MSEQYKKIIEEYEETTEFQTVPKYPNKEPMKDVNKHNQGVLNSLQNAHKKNFKTNFKILEKHLLILKGKTNSYIEAFNLVQNHFEEVKQKKKTLEQTKKQTKQVQKLRDQVDSQRKKELTENEVKMQKEKIMTSDRVKDMESVLNEREKEVLGLRQRYEIAKQANQHMQKTKEKVLKQVKEQINEMDKDFQQKQQQVSEFFEKQTTGIEDFKKSLQQTKDIEQKKSEEQKFQDDYQERATKVIETAQRYEDMISDTFADLKKVKKLSEKVANKNNKQGSNRMNELKKIQQLNKRVWDYLTVNEGYRAKIEQEKKKQQILQKMANDLETKIKELQE